VGRDHLILTFVGRRKLRGLKEGEVKALLFILGEQALRHRGARKKKARGRGRGSTPERKTGTAPEYSTQFELRDRKK